MFIICNLRWWSGMQVWGTHNGALQADILVLRVLVLAEGRGCCGCGKMTYRKSIPGFERRQATVRPLRAVPMCLWILTIALKRGGTGSKIVHDWLPASYTYLRRQTAVRASDGFSPPSPEIVTSSWRNAVLSPEENVTSATVHWLGRLIEVRKCKARTWFLFVTLRCF